MHAARRDFSSSGALPRLVASSLERLEIRIMTVSATCSRHFESAGVAGWIELQRAPRLNSFSAFCKRVARSGGRITQNQPTSFQKILHEKFKSVLDDLELLREFCSTRVDDKSQSAAEALRALPFLPPRATLAQFLEQTHAALAHLDWKQHALELANVRVYDVAAVSMRQFSPRFFCAGWKKPAATSDGRRRSAAGDHPYAQRAIAHGGARAKSGMVALDSCRLERRACRRGGAEFARAREIHAFIRSVQQLNKRAARQGSQGEGHTSGAENHSLY